MPASAASAVVAARAAYRAHDAYIAHSADCWAQGDTRKCPECRGLSLDAEAEDWRRSQAREGGR